MTNSARLLRSLSLSPTRRRWYLGARSCLFSTGADQVQTLAVYLGMLDLDFTVTGPPELVAELQQLARRYLTATGTAATRTG